MTRGARGLVASAVLALSATAGPREFGLAELSRALAKRKMDPARFRISADIVDDVPGAWRITGARVSGGDLRGLMYGLLEAADQIRARGFLVPARGKPALAIRGVRVELGAEDFGRPPEYWNDYFETLARSRINRLAVTIAGDAAGRIDALRKISEIAAGYAVDVTIAVSNEQGGALGGILARCPLIRVVQVGAPVSGIVETIAGSGRRVTLEADGGAAVDTPEVPVRYVARFGGEAFGRPHPKPAEFLWRVGPGPVAVREAVPFFIASGASGFELESPDLAGALSWGRLGYDPKPGEKALASDPERQLAGAVEAGPIDAGAPIEAYRLAPPGDPRFTASAREAVDDEIHGRATARCTPLETAEKLHAAALAIEQSLARAAERPAIERRLRASIALARFHARKQLAAYFLSHFYASENDTGLYAARREITGALASWRDLAKIEPRARAHTPAVERDLAWLNAGVRSWERFGRFDAAFDFGGSQPRFRRVDARTLYDDAAGFGWLGAGERIPAGPSIRGRGAQSFRYRSGEGEFDVRVLYPDGSEEARAMRSRDGVLDIAFSGDEWTVGGLVIRKRGPRPETHPPVWTVLPPRPAIAHTPPVKAVAGSPLALSIRVTPPSAASAIRLYYRPLAAGSKFRVMASVGAAAAFTIPASELTPEWDLIYCFEVLSPGGRGWFESDSYRIVEVTAPAAATP